VTVKPLKQITGDAEFNEVYFDNVKVPEANILGGLNNGWAVGMTTLMYRAPRPRLRLQVRLRIAPRRARRSRAAVPERRGARTEGPRPIRQKLAQLWIDTRSSSTRRARHHQALKGETARPRASGGKMMWVEGTSDSRSSPMELQGSYAQLGRGQHVGRGRRRLAAQLLTLARQLDRGRHRRRSQKNIIRRRACLGLPLRLDHATSGLQRTEQELLPEHGAQFFLT